MKTTAVAVMLALSLTGCAAQPDPAPTPEPVVLTCTVDYRTMSASGGDFLLVTQDCNPEMGAFELGVGWGSTPSDADRDCSDVITGDVVRLTDDGGFVWDCELLKRADQ